MIVVNRYREAGMTAGQGHEGEPEGGGRSGTEGHGGSRGPDGPPQGWSAPPPPPQDWSAPPPPHGWYGSPPPHGWNAPPSQPNPYAAPPQGYGPPPAGSPDQPLTVRAGIGAFVVNFVLGLVYSMVSFADLDELVRQEVAATDDPAITEDVIRTIIVIIASISLVFALLYALFIWWAWRGRNWARIVLWVLGGFSVLAGLASFGGSTGQSGFLTSLGVFQTLALIVGIVLLALKASNDWYRYMRWARASGQPR